MKDSKLIMSYIKKQPKRTMFIIISIIISTALIATVGLLSSSIKANLIEDTKNAYGEQYARIEVTKDKEVEYIQDNPIFNKVGLSCIYGTTDFSEKLRLNIEAWDNKTMDIENCKLIKGTFPEKYNEICIDEWYLEEMNLPNKIGSKIKLNLSCGVSKNYHEFSKEFILSGVIKNKAGSKYSGSSLGIVSFLAIKDLPEELVKYGVFVVPKETISVEKALKEISKIQSKLNIKKDKIQINSGLINLIKDSNKPNITTILFTLIVSIAAIAVIYNIFNISIIGRIRDYGVLRCIGFRTSKIKKIVLKEGFILSIISIPLGLILGCLISKAVYKKVISLSNVVNAKLTFSYKILIFAAVVSLIGVFISTLIPAFHASKISPLQAVLNTTTSSKINHKKQGFISNFFENINSFAYKNLWRNKKRTLVTIFSLGFSIVLFIVSTYYFNHFPMYDPSTRFTNGDFKLGVSDFYNGSKLYTDNDVDTIKNIPGVKKVIKNRTLGLQAVLKKENMTKKFLNAPRTNLKTEGNKYILQSYGNGYTKDMLKDLSKYVVKGNLNIDSFCKNNEIIINKTDFTNMLNLKVGDEIILREYEEDKPNPKQKSFKIAAIVSDMPYFVQKKGFKIPFIVNEKVLKNFFNVDGYNEIDISINKNANIKTIEDNLKTIADKVPTGLCTSYFEAIDTIKKSRKNISILMNSFVGFLAIISILNIVNTMNTNILMRVKEFGVLRAIGLNKKHVKKIVLYEGMFYGILSFIFGLIISSIVCILLYNVVEGMKPGAPILSMLIALIISIIVCISASLYPLKKVTSSNIVDSIRDNN
ncbi:ABC transporter permease (plasmid) [Haloimpatiens sp. FM7330]|uniref:ABC transporter permease n=1 Tax=Haloimpatiens sp. FM7330 TaxID=3298610 RepID=UPI003641B550